MVSIVNDLEKSNEEIAGKEAEGGYLFSEVAILSRQRRKLEDEKILAEDRAANYNRQVREYFSNIAEAQLERDWLTQVAQTREKQIKEIDKQLIKARKREDRNARRS